MYMQNHRCKVTGSNSSKKLAKPKAPVWCKDEPSKCVTGAKQMMAWHREWSHMPLGTVLGNNLEIDWSLI